MPICYTGDTFRLLCPTATDWIRKLHEKPCDRLGFSQGNQDCVIVEIFSRVSTTNRFYLEYGFNTKTQCTGSMPNTCVLSKKTGWKGLLLDAKNENAQINLRKHPLFARNIVSIFASYNVPLNLDYLSSDMDSHDYFVMRSILESGIYRPRVISTEYNFNYPFNWSMALLDPFLDGFEGMESYKFKPSGCAWGVSASGWRFLMERFGYRMVALTPRLDIFWVRKDLLANVFVPDFSYFSISSSPHHFKLQSAEELTRIVDVAVYEATKNIAIANVAALEKIYANLQSSNSVNWCYSELNATEVRTFMNTRVEGLLVK